jgi:uncharacterized membrane protein YgcG
VPVSERWGGLSPRQRFLLEDAVRKAELASRVEFSVFLGTAEGEPRAFAGRLHSTLKAPRRSVLVMVDPVAGALEIVTGADVRARLSDEEVALAAEAMASCFREGALLDGLTRGIAMLADHARSS